MPTDGRHLTPAYSGIYLHFLDFYHYARALRAMVGDPAYLILEARRAVRIAALVAEQLYLPASSYFEGVLAREILAEHEEFCELGLIQTTASQESLKAHREGKLAQYSKKSPPELIEAYKKMPEGNVPGYVQHGGSSRAIIGEDWTAYAKSERLARAWREITGEPPPARLEPAWVRVPEMLEGRAFVTSHVQELLAGEKITAPEKMLVGVIEPAYIRGYLETLGVGIVGDLIHLKSPFPLPAKPCVSYTRWIQHLQAIGLMRVIDGATPSQLLALKHSSEWSNLAPAIANRDPVNAELAKFAEQAVTVATGRHRFPDNARPECGVGIVTALPIEYSAMKGLIENGKTYKQRGDPAEYWTGTIPAVRDGKKIGDHRVALTQMRRAGTQSAAAAATDLLRTFPDARLILMVGIACGIPAPEVSDRHVRLGDIIVSDRRGIVEFTAGALKRGALQPRDTAPPPSARFIAVIDALEHAQIAGEYPWEHHLKTLICANGVFRRPGPGTDRLLDIDGIRITHPADPLRQKGGHPRVFRGLIGSSDLLLRDFAVREYLRDTFNLRAIEMEGSGIAHATWTHDQPYGVIRTACDYGDDRTKDDRWHGYASAVAASYARAAIERLAVEDFDSR